MRRRRIGYAQCCRVRVSPRFGRAFSPGCADIELHDDFGAGSTRATTSLTYAWRWFSRIEYLDRSVSAVRPEHREA